MAREWATRLYVATGLAPGASVPLSEEQAHRLRAVLRLAPGASIAAFNAAEGEFLCRLEQLGRRHATLAVERRLREAAPEPGPILLFAPIKRARLDWLVEKATELGAVALFPVLTARTQAERLNRDRLAAIALAAVEQSERLSLPEIDVARPLDQALADWPRERPLLVCDESGAGMAIATAVARLSSEMRLDRPLGLLVGPEGGFTETELDGLGKLSFVTRIGLGPRILRAETAALAALAILQAGMFQAGTFQAGVCPAGVSRAGLSQPAAMPPEVRDGRPDRAF